MRIRRPHAPERDDAKAAESTAASGRSSKLSVRNLVSGYNGVSVLHEVTFDVRPGEILGLLGPNGAGKTTLLRTIAGSIRAQSGSVLFDDRDIVRRKPHERARLGLSFIPERGSTFAPLTVQENLRASCWRRDESRFEEVRDLFPELAQRWHQRASTLSGGERQMLALAKAFVARPTVLLVDEISTGLAPKVVARCFDYILQLRSLDISIIVVDQYVERIREMSDHVIVLARGHIAFDGTSRAADADTVWRYYLT